jgi:hypothetical protein
VVSWDSGGEVRISSDALGMLLSSRESWATGEGMLPFSRGARLPLAQGGVCISSDALGMLLSHVWHGLRGRECFLSCVGRGFLFAARGAARCWCTYRNAVRARGAYFGIAGGGERISSDALGILPSPRGSRSAGERNASFPAWGVDSFVGAH